MKISYNWLQDYFEEKLPEPEKISESIIFHSFEVEGMEKTGKDVIFDIKVLPDRAHDCLSHWGIAKEISAIFDLEIKEKKYKIFEPQSTKLNIKIEDKKCLRYMGRIVKNIKIGASPDWLKEKLNALEQKSINNVVDAANFVMFDLGQPIHCFDLDKLENEKIIIRNAKKGEIIITLDKKEIDLDDSVLLITDEKKPLAIAGIKGGAKGEVNKDTKNIIIEVANFNSVAIRKTSKKVGIFTDAVKRYENEISPELCETTMYAITDLICNLTGGTAEEIVDIYPEKAKQKTISVSTEYINKRLGSDFSKKDIESVWRKLNFKYLGKDDEFEIQVPFLRIDIAGPHDLTEEVIRILGYDKLREKLPEIKTETEIDDTYLKILWARDKLLSEGYNEVMTYVFRNKGELEVMQSASDKTFLRANLSDGLKESLKLNKINAPLLGLNEIKIFEIGTIFKKSGEEMHVAYGDEKEIKEITLQEFITQASPDALAREYPATQRHRSQEHVGSSTFHIWSLFPFIVRDVAVWVPEGIESNHVVKIIKENAGNLLMRGPEFFDEFKKDNKISYAFRLVFQSYDRTLTDSEVNEIMNKIIEKIQEHKDWQIR